MLKFRSFQFILFDKIWSVWREQVDHRQKKFGRMRLIVISFDGSWHLSLFSSLPCIPPSINYLILVVVHDEFCSSQRGQQLLFSSFNVIISILSARILSCFSFHLLSSSNFDCNFKCIRTHPASNRCHSDHLKDSCSSSKRQTAKPTTVHDELQSSSKYSAIFPLQQESQPPRYEAVQAIHQQNFFIEWRKSYG